MSEEKRRKAKPRRQKGYVFQKVNSKTGEVSPYWTIQYFDRGKRVRKAAGVNVRTKEQAAEVLADRLAKVRNREAEETRKGKAVTVGQLFEDLKEDVETERNSRGKRSLEELGWRWAHLSPVFKNSVAVEVTSEDVRDYKRSRQKEGAADATINRELATLRRMFNFALEEKRIRSAPSIKLITENNTRQGFLEDDEYRKLAAEASGWMRCLISLAYTYGWRRSELLDLRVRQVNLTNLTIRLDPGTTKNGEGREVRMTSEVAELLKVALVGKERQKDAYVLTREDGRPISEFRGAWGALFRAADVPLRTLHDFRRSAAKALRRAGVPESVAQATLGHKTPSLFRRYAIVSDSDNRKAVEMLEAARLRTPSTYPLEENEPGREPLVQ